MLITLPSGQMMFAPRTPRTWTDQAPGVTGTPVMSSDLETYISSEVAYQRTRTMFQGIGGSQSVPNASWTPISLTEIWDAARGHNDNSNPSRVAADITPAGDDWYLCTGHIPWLASGAGQMVVAGVRVNGGTVYEGAKLPSGSVYDTTVMVCDLIRLHAFDYVELVGYQDSGGTLSTDASATKAPYLTMRWAATASGGTVVAAPGTPRTWTAADKLTADLAGPGQVPLNVHVRDVLRWLQYPPACRIDSAGTTQQIPSGAWTSINFVAEQFDNYGGHSTSVNPSRYVVQRPGRYLVYGLAALTETGTTGQRVSRLLVNGTTAYAGTSIRPPSVARTGTALPACAHIRLNAGDYVELQVYQSQGSNLAVRDGTGNASRLVMLWRTL